MGIEYYLAREDNHTLFRIGKLSAISDLFLGLGDGRACYYGFLPRAVPSEPDLRVLIRVAIDDSNLSVDRDEYAAELARRIVAFADGQWVLVLNDASNDELMDEHYSTDDDPNVIDSVYTADWGDWAERHPLVPLP